MITWSHLEQSRCYHDSLILHKQWGPKRIIFIFTFVMNVISSWLFQAWKCLSSRLWRIFVGFRRSRMFFKPWKKSKGQVQNISYQDLKNDLRSPSCLTSNLKLFSNVSLYVTNNLPDNSTMIFAIFSCNVLPYLLNRYFSTQYMAAHSLLVQKRQADKKVVILGDPDTGKTCFIII